MSTKTQAPVRNRSFLRWLIPLSLLLLCIAGAAIWLFLSSGSKSELPPLVQINSPSTGSTAEINTPLTVQASAEGSDSFKRVELYSDGALVAVEDSTLDGGSNPLIFSQNYTPLTLGRHVLMARGYSADNKFSDSSVVYLDVLEPSSASQTINVDAIPNSGGTMPSVNDMSRLHGVAPDQILAANPDLNGTNPSSPLSPGTILHIPPRPRNPAPTDGTPPPTPIASARVAPTALNLTVDCTSTQLTWTDNTTDESGFLIYRLAPGDSLLTLVATLPANTTTYHETLSTLGTYRYQVAALRGSQEGLSLMQSGSTPDLCVPPASSIETVALSILSLDTTEAYDGVYCYFNINGSGYQRAPEADFTYLTPEADGLTYNLARQLPNHGQFILGVPTDEGPLTFGGECWGQRGPISTEIGSPFTASHLRADWDGRDLFQTAMEGAGKPVAALESFTGGYNLRLHYRLSTNTPSARAQAIESQFDVSRLDPTAIRSILAPVIPEPLYGPGFPIITNLRIEHSFRGCDEFRVDGVRAYCVLGSLPIGGPLTILWDLTVRDSAIPESSLDRYVVTIRNPSRNTILMQTPIQRIESDAIRTSLILPARDLPCGSRIQVRVDGFVGPMQLDAPSAIFWIMTEPCRGPLAMVTVTFSTLEVGHVAETDEQVQPAAIDDWLELQGGVTVDREGRILVNSLLNYDYWWVPVQGADPSLSPTRSFDMTDRTMPNGLTFIRNYEDFPRTSAPPIFIVPIMTGEQTITIGSSIYDVDATWPAPLRHPGRTSTCGTRRIELGPRSSTLWSTLRQIIILGDPWPNSEECRITVSIVGSVRP